MILKTLSPTPGLNILHESVSHGFLGEIVLMTKKSNVLIFRVGLEISSGVQLGQYPQLCLRMSSRGPMSQACRGRNTAEFTNKNTVKHALQIGAIFSFLSVCSGQS